MHANELKGERGENLPVCPPISKPIFGPSPNCPVRELSLRDGKRVREALVCLNLGPSQTILQRPERSYRQRTTGRIGTKEVNENENQPTSHHSADETAEHKHKICSREGALSSTALISAPPPADNASTTTAASSISLCSPPLSLPSFALSLPQWFCRHVRSTDRPKDRHHHP